MTLCNTGKNASPVVVELPSARLPFDALVVPASFRNGAGDFAFTLRQAALDI